MIDPHSTYRIDVLVAEGIITSEIQEDSHLGHLFTTDSVYGAIVLNALSRAGIIEPNGIAVNAYHFSESTGISFDRVLNREVEKRPLAVLHEFEGGEDLGIKIEDIHHYFTIHPKLDELGKLVLRYQDTRDVDAFRFVCEAGYSFVRFVAGQFAKNLPSNVEYEDLVGYGTLGLIDAIEKFDRDKNFKFRTYAKTRIRGAILDEIRVLDFLPRTYRQRTTQLMKAIEEITHEFGESRHFSSEEISECTGMSVEDVEKARNINVDYIISMDESPEDIEGFNTMTHTADPRQTSPHDRYWNKQMEEILEEAVRQGMGTSNRIDDWVNAYIWQVFENIPTTEIARRLGVSDSRISQITNKPGVRRVLHKLLDLPKEKTEIQLTL